LKSGLQEIATTPPTATDDDKDLETLYNGCIHLSGSLVERLSIEGQER
jgi:hypothetical protein